MVFASMMEARLVKQPVFETVKVDRLHVLPSLIFWLKKQKESDLLC